MPIYCYICDGGHRFEEFKFTFEPPVEPECPLCGKGGSRDIGSENCNTDCGDHERFSDSMGVNPDQIPLAVKTFPGSEYAPDGRLKIKNRAHKKLEMRRRGYVELQ